MNATALDMDARYSVRGFGGVAFYLLGWATEEVYEGDLLVCDDEECDHGLSEMCWAPGETSLSESSPSRWLVVSSDVRPRA